MTCRSWRVPLRADTCRRPQRFPAVPGRIRPGAPTIGAASGGAANPTGTRGPLTAGSPSAKPASSPPTSLGIGLANSPRRLVAPSHADRGLHYRGGGDDAVHHRDPDPRADVHGQVGHPGAAQHDHVATVQCHRPCAFLRDRGSRGRAGDLELEDGYVAGPDFAAEPRRRSGGPGPTPAAQRSVAASSRR